MPTPNRSAVIRTVLQQAEAEIIEKKSRFIASVSPVKTEADALAFLEALRKKYYNAAHNCYAYQIGVRHELRRFSDDGEPGGTAGMPMLNVLQAEDAHNTIVVVTRYFGGTLLGAGGLVRAYTRATHDGLQAARLIEKKRYARFTVDTDYSLSGKVQYETVQAGHILHDTVYTDMVRFIVLVAQAQAEAFVTLMKDVTAATAIVAADGFIYVADVDKKLMLFNEEEEMQ